MNETKALSFVKFNSAKTMDAIEATPKQNTLFAMGEELGAVTAESSVAWSDALKACKSHADRLFLRAGFVSVYAPMRGVAEKSAIQKFDRLAKTYAPETSRKAKSNKETRGRKEKATKTVSKLSDKDVQSRLVAALAWTAKQQQRHNGDDEVLELLGELAAILGGKRK
jgi:hypothetical protein